MNELSQKLSWETLMEPKFMSCARHWRIIPRVKCYHSSPFIYVSVNYRILNLQNSLIAKQNECKAVSETVPETYNWCSLRVKRVF